MLYVPIITNINTPWYIYLWLNLIIPKIYQNPSSLFVLQMKLLQRLEIASEPKQQ